MPLALDLLPRPRHARREIRMKRCSGRNASSTLPAPVRFSLLAAGLLLAAALATPARAATVYALRVRLHPDAAAPGTLPPSLQARLEALAGTSLTLAATTRTGALELALAEPRDAADLRGALRALRGDRAVLWAEAAMPRGAAQALRQRKPKSINPVPGAQSDRGSKLLVRLAEG